MELEKIFSHFLCTREQEQPSSLEMMYLHIVILALTFASTTALPLNHDSSQEASWSLQKDNQATDKKNFAKDPNSGMWKNHVVSSDLYSQDSSSPMAAELRYKLSMESERLRARLKQELAELRQRLSPYPSHPKHTLANVREFLAPFTKQLQTALQTNTQELCDKLNLNLQDLNPDEAALYQEVVQKITLALDESHQKRTAAFENFKTKAFEAVEEQGDSSGKELWEEVTARLGQEVCTFSLEIQGKVAALKIALVGHLASAQPPRDVMTSKVDQFCQNSFAHNQQFISNLDQHIITLQENVSNGESSAFHQTNIESIQEDFSTRLSALLQDIIHTLN